MTEIHAPNSFEDAAGVLAEATSTGRRVRIRGGATKLGWGARTPSADLELDTRSLAAISEHNAGDLTAVVQAGLSLAELQAALARHGQMLALDPPLGSGEAATVGGVFATADSGPLRHRYGSPRELILGVTVALSDGSLARAGGKVIKNVAGYDLAKLFTGSYGTLGAILQLSVRLHPLPASRVTAMGIADGPAELAGATAALASAPLELESLDVAWRGGRGGLLARCAGHEPRRRAERAAAIMRQAGLSGVELADDDEPLWARQRAGQRSAQRTLVQVATRPSRLAEVLRGADAAEATMVGRAALGQSYLEADAEMLEQLWRALPEEAHVLVTDAPESVREEWDTWGAADTGPRIELSRRLKHRFDPTATCNPGIFVGGI